MSVCLSVLVTCRKRLGSFDRAATQQEAGTEDELEDEDGLPKKSRKSMARELESAVPGRKERSRSRTFGGAVQLYSTGSMDDLDKTDDEEDEDTSAQTRVLGRASKRIFRTGATADWLGHTRSFKVSSQIVKRLPFRLTHRDFTCSDSLEFNFTWF
jgi:hypothetical protein